MPSAASNAAADAAGLRFEVICVIVPLLSVAGLNLMFKVFTAALLLGPLRGIKQSLVYVCIKSRL